MDVQRYLERIKFPIPKDFIRADLPTLYLVQSCQQQNIPYENLDVLLGKRIVLKNDVIYDKMVTQRRGGWCHELNGLLGWALREIGYDVKLDVNDVGFHLIVGRKYRFSRPVGSTKRRNVVKEDDLSLERFSELLREIFGIEIDISGIDWSQIGMEENTLVKTD